MARIPEEIIERLKTEVSLQRLAESAPVRPSKWGQVAYCTSGPSKWGQVAYCTSGKTLRVRLSYLDILSESRNGSSPAAHLLPLHRKGEGVRA